jgi:cystathionine beta-synthase
VVLPDGIRNYMTKFVDDKWMRDNGFFQTHAIEGRVEDIMIGRTGTIEVAEDTDTLREVVEKMRDRGISQLPVTSGGVLVGMVTEADLMNFLGSGEGTPDALVAKCMTRHVASVRMTTPLSALEELLTRSPAAVVVNDDRQPIGILSRIDLLYHLARPRTTA